MTRKWQAPFLFLLVLSPSRTVAQAPDRAWYAGIGSGWYFPIQKWESAYTLGGGGSFFVGRRLDTRWAVRLDANMWLCSGSGRDTWDIKVTPQLLRSFAKRRLAPFVLTGLGLDYQIDYPGKAAAVSAVVPAGIGLEWQLHARSSVFLEGIHYILFSHVTTRDIPVLVGFHADL